MEEKSLVSLINSLTDSLDNMEAEQLITNIKELAEKNLNWFKYQMVKFTLDSEAAIMWQWLV